MFTPVKKIASSPHRSTIDGLASFISLPTMVASGIQPSSGFQREHRHQPQQVPTKPLPRPSLSAWFPEGREGEAKLENTHTRTDFYKGGSQSCVCLLSTSTNCMGWYIQWCRISPLFAFSIRDLMDSYKYIRGSKWWKKTIHAVILTAFWVLWRVRNNNIFNDKLISLDKIIHDIKIMGFPGSE
ncbi:hypothetical protein R6Q59_004637, partial [Mikania micrantha]